MIVYLKVSKSFWGCLLMSLINISLLSSCDWEGVGFSAVLAALVLPGIVPYLISRQLSQQYIGEIWQQLLWTALTAIFWWDSAAIFWWDLAAIPLDGFDSNILVSFGSNSLWAALVATFLVRFGSDFSRAMHSIQYFGPYWAYNMNIII